MTHYCKKCGKVTSEKYDLCVRCTQEQQQVILLEAYRKVQNGSIEIKRKKATRINVCQKCGQPSRNEICNNCAAEMQEKIQKPSLKTFHKIYAEGRTIRCKNGLMVRSQGERKIANFLYENNIPFQYEIGCRYGEYNIETHETKAKILRPDFFIKGPVLFRGRWLKDIYIEYWGLDDYEYQAKMEYKMNVYKQHKCTLINLDFDDYNNLEAILANKLKWYIAYSNNK
ncbi:MAG: hypothetical protein E7435_05635 [Ruminococcaceae bacterium]|nr:hypothetical protein [Oscillospiraceae bacterium]